MRSATFARVAASSGASVATWGTARIAASTSYHPSVSPALALQAGKRAETAAVSPRSSQTPSKASIGSTTDSCHAVATP